MQSTTVLSFTQDNKQPENITKPKDKPDIDAVSAWLRNHLEIIACMHESEPDEWELFDHSPYLVLLTEDIDLGKFIMESLCETADVVSHVLPPIENDALELLATLQKPFDQPQLLQIHHPELFSTEGSQPLIASLSDLMDRYATERKLLIVCIANVSQLNNLDPSLKSIHTFDKRIFLNSRLPRQYAQHFLSLFLGPYQHQSLYDDLETLGKLVEMEFPDERLMGLSAVNLTRKVRAERENHQITFNDVVRQSVVGNTECFYRPHDDDFMAFLALHEAGHATMMMLASNGENIPQYATLIESVNHTGCVLEDINYRYRVMKRPTFNDLLNRIRICLAGRAATQTAYDLMDTFIAGDASDLRKASYIARDLIITYGLKVTSDQPVSAYEHTLLSLEEGHVNIERMNQQVEMLVNAEYKRVQALLQQHHALLMQVKTELLAKKELWQADLKTIWADYQNI